MNTRFFVAAAAFAAAAFGSTLAHAQYRWQSFNTCWSDFDVGGGWLCMLRMPECASAGINENDRLHCTTNVGTELPPSNGQMGWAMPPRSKAIAVDEAGAAWVVTTDNRIFREGGFGESFGQFAAPGLACISKLAVTLNGTTPRVLALGCDAARTLRRYASGSWTTIATNVLDVTTLTLEDGTNYLSYVSNNANRSWFRSGQTGTGAFWMWKPSTIATDSWTSGGKTQSVVFKADTFGSSIGVNESFASCDSTGGTGRAWFRDFELDEFLGPDPSGCVDLQVPSPLVNKVAAGGRGPGPDMLWVRTEQGRVFGLMAR